MSPKPTREYSLLILVFLALVSCGYYGTFYLTQNGFLSEVPLSMLIFPSAWLSAVCAIAIHRIGLSFELFKGGRRIRVGVVWVICLIVFAFAITVYWPDRSAGGNYRSLLQRSLVVLLIPIGEELFFRGLLLDRLNQIFKSKVAAAVLSSVLFGLAHYPQGITIALTILVLAGLLCAVTFLTGSLIWPVAIHIGWNALAVIRETPPGQQRWTISIISVCCLLALLILAIHTRANTDTKR